MERQSWSRPMLALSNFRETGFQDQRRRHRNCLPNSIAPLQRLSARTRSRQLGEPKNHNSNPPTNKTAATILPSPVVTSLDASKKSPAARPDASTLNDEIARLRYLVVIIAERSTGPVHKMRLSARGAGHGFVRILIDGRTIVSEPRLHFDARRGAAIEHGSHDAL
jgi:hypothetical protein